MIPTHSIVLEHSIDQEYKFSTYLNCTPIHKKLKEIYVEGNLDFCSVLLPGEFWHLHYFVKNLTCMVSLDFT